MSRSAAQTLGTFAFVVALIGVFLPWSTGVVGFAESSGLDGPGAIALLFGAVGGIALFASRDSKTTLIAVGCAAALIVIGIFGIMGVEDEIESELGELNDLLGIVDEQAKVGIGLYVLIGGGVAALVLSLAHLVTGAKSPAAVPPTQR